MSIMFPRAVVIIMGIFAAALAVKGLLGPERRDIFAEGSNVRWIVTGILFFLWIIAVAYIGFWVSTVVGISVMVFYLSRATRRAPLPVLLGWVAVVTTEVTIFYLIFRKVLGVPLPTGLLF